MAGLRVQYTVIMEDPDERELTITVDQRDFAAMEAREDLPGETAWHTKGRFLTWSAMRRQKLTSASWQEFNETLCVSVEAAPEKTEAEEDEQSLDPGPSPASVVS